MASYYSSSVQIKQALINLLTENLGANGVIPGVIVGPTSISQNSSYPYIGVRIVNEEEKFMVNHGVRNFITFQITVLTMTKTKEADAIAQRDLLVDDGNGKGVKPLLRQQMYDLLGGLLEKCEIGKTKNRESSNVVTQGVPSQFFAAAGIEWNVQHKIVFNQGD